MKTFWKVLPAFVLMMACKGNNNKASLPFYNTPDFTPVWLSPGDDGYGRIHKIPSFNLVNQLGQSISNKNTSGKVYVANFFFTSCPTLCPRTMANMALVQQAFAKDTGVLILSHSVTPVKDNVP